MASRSGPHRSRNLGCLCLLRGEEPPVSRGIQVETLGSILPPACPCHYQVACKPRKDSEPRAAAWASLLFAHGFDQEAMVET